MKLHLRGRVVLVTGASSGIGKATAIAFGHEGARVALTYLTRRDAAERTAADVEAAGGQAMVVPLDLGVRSSVADAVGSVVTRWDGLDVVVANAVRWPRDAGGPFGQADESAWATAVRTNLEGTAATVKEAWPSLCASSQGRVVLVSTGVTRSGMRGATAYATAKSGLEGLAAALKWEGGDAGVLVNVVAPGFTVTERNLATFGDDVREPVRQRTPSGRLSIPEDVAAAVVFLSSGANGNITGTYLSVAGGTD